MHILTKDQSVRMYRSSYTGVYSTVVAFIFCNDPDFFSIHLKPPFHYAVPLRPSNDSVILHVLLDIYKCKCIQEHLAYV